MLYCYLNSGMNQPYVLSNNGRCLLMEYLKKILHDSSALRPNIKIISL